MTSWCLRNDKQTFTFVILYLDIVFIPQWLFDGNSEILHYSDVFASRQNLCKPQSIFKQTRVNCFYRENMTSFLNYVTATLRALFAWRGSYGLMKIQISLWRLIWFISLVYFLVALFSDSNGNYTYRVSNILTLSIILTWYHIHCRATLLDTHL